jgi:hypothetical protein
MSGTGVVAALEGSESNPDVFLLFRGRGGEMSRARLEGSAILVELMS